MIDKPVIMPFATTDISVEPDGKGSLVMSFSGASWMMTEALIHHDPDDVIAFLTETKGMMIKDINEYFDEKIAAIQANKDSIREAVNTFKETESSFQKMMVKMQKLIKK